MIRVLHLLPSDADFQTQRCAAQLCERNGEGIAAEMRTIGRGGDFGGVAGAVLALRRLRGFDLIHAWGQTALITGAVGYKGPIVYSPSVSAGRRNSRWLRAVMAHRPVEVVCPTATMRRALAESGVPLERCHLIRPGVEFGKARKRRNNELRAALGFSDDSFVLLAAGESTPEADHRDAVWAASILHVLDERYRLLLWGRGGDMPRVTEFARRLANPRLTSVAEQRLGRRVEFEELLSAADMAIVTATGAVATLPVCICMAAGLPIVASVSYTIGELLEDRHTALLVRNRSPRLMAQKIMQFREDSALQWKLADMARTEAYEFFAMTRFMEQFRGVYKQAVAGERVEVAEPAPGAGMRFHGRG